jgi:Fe-Mn family superoxide dismutase
MSQPEVLRLPRRTLFAATASVLILGATRSRAWAQAAAPAATGPFTLPPLPYAPDANEPSIDAQTMSLHHDKHHAAYVANLNAALKDHGELAALPLPVLLTKISEVPDTIRTVVRNNAGGHANHSMFWTLMGGKGGEPTGPVAAAVSRDFGSYVKLKEGFQKAGLGVFGSGWVFVTVDPAGKLALVTRPNQDTPLMDGQRVLFGNDMWEHAYYLKYQNRRADYLTAWWNVLNWDAIAVRYASAQAGTLAI